jgi:hypothetical protein
MKETEMPWVRVSGYIQVPEEHWAPTGPTRDGQQEIENTQVGDLDDLNIDTVSQAEAEEVGLM